MCIRFDNVNVHTSIVHICKSLKQFVKQNSRYIKYDFRLKYFLSLWSRGLTFAHGLVKESCILHHSTWIHDKSVETCINHCIFRLYYLYCIRVVFVMCLCFIRQSFYEDKALIAAQYPLEEQAEDFLRLLIDYESNIVISTNPLKDILSVGSLII